jgi:predicted TIM-barrel enzyme
MKDKHAFAKLFPHKPVIGMIHLKALPGAPDYAGNFRNVLDCALKDASALEDGGVDGMMIENFFDAPFFKEQVGPETVAAMACIASTLRQQTRLPLGVNVLRNDGISALAIATVCDCQFVRINQLLDTWERGGADALIVSGMATGQETDYRDVVAAKKGAPDAPVLIGSGVSDANLDRYLPVADGVIVGTFFKREGKVENPVDVSRVRAVVALKQAAYSG